MSCRSRSAGRATVQKTLAHKTGSPLYELILGPEYHRGPVVVISGLQSPRCIVVRVYGLVGNRSAETNSRTVLRSAGSGTQLAPRSRSHPGQSYTALDSDASRCSISTAQGSSIMACNCQVLRGNSALHLPIVTRRI